MRRVIKALELWSARCRMESALKRLHERHMLVLAVQEFGIYQRVYIPRSRRTRVRCMSPGTARAYLKDLERQTWGGKSA